MSPVPPRKRAREMPAAEKTMLAWCETMIDMQPLARKEVSRILVRGAVRLARLGDEESLLHRAAALWLAFKLTCSQNSELDVTSCVTVRHLAPPCATLRHLAPHPFLAPSCVSRWLIAGVPSSELMARCTGVTITDLTRAEFEVCDAAKWRLMRVFLSPMKDCAAGGGRRVAAACESPNLTLPRTPPGHV